MDPNHPWIRCWAKRRDEDSNEEHPFATRTHGCRGDSRPCSTLSHSAQTSPCVAIRHPTPRLQRRFPHLSSDAPAAVEQRMLRSHPSRVLILRSCAQSSLFFSFSFSNLDAVATGVWKPWWIRRTDSQQLRSTVNSSRTNKLNLHKPEEILEDKLLTGRS